MRESDFRRMALAMDGAVEGAHMGHPDFRVNNRIFVTLHHDRRSGGLMLTPEQQAECPAPIESFVPAAVHGRGGATTVQLASVSKKRSARRDAGVAELINKGPSSRRAARPTADRKTVT